MYYLPDPKWLPGGIAAQTENPTDPKLYDSTAGKFWSGLEVFCAINQEGFLNATYIFVVSKPQEKRNESWLEN